jgi:hypothetical protein
VEGELAQTAVARLKDKIAAPRADEGLYGALDPDVRRTGSAWL